jgi:excisionase family DNA binding protein
LAIVKAKSKWLILGEASRCLGVSKMTVVRLIRHGLLPARQVCAGAPYVIREDDLARPAIRQATLDSNRSDLDLVALTLEDDAVVVVGLRVVDFAQIESHSL